MANPPCPPTRIFDDSDFEAFVRQTLAKIVEGQLKLETKLAASIQFNSDRIEDLKKSGSAVTTFLSSLNTEAEKRHKQTRKFFTTE